MESPLSSATDSHSGLRLTTLSNSVSVGSFPAESNTSPEEGLLSLPLLLRPRELKDEVLIVIFFLFF